MASEPATGAARLPAAARRETILNAAGPLFARDGYAATRIDAVAAAAGVTKPIVYRHFGSKKGLYVAQLERHEADLPTFFAGLGDLAGAEPDVLVRALLDRWLDYVRDHRYSWTMLFRDSSADAEIEAVRMRVSARARAVIAAFVAERAGDRIPAEQVVPTAELLTSGLAGMVLWWIDNPEVPKPVLLETALRIVAPVLGGHRPM